MPEFYEFSEGGQRVCLRPQDMTRDQAFRAMDRIVSDYAVTSGNHDYGQCALALTEKHPDLFRRYYTAGNFASDAQEERLTKAAARRESAGREIVKLAQELVDTGRAKNFAEAAMQIAERYPHIMREWEQSAGGDAKG